METIVQTVWAKSKLLIKALMIGALVLIMLIPTYYVKELITERETRQKEAIADVSSKWAGRQVIRPLPSSCGTMLRTAVCPATPPYAAVGQSARIAVR